MSTYEQRLKTAQAEIEMAREDARDGDQTGSMAHAEIAQRLLREAMEIARRGE